MVIDSMEDAVQYRRLLQPHNIPTPAMLALRELKALSADNTERLGINCAAPSSERIVPRLGVLSVGVQRVIDSVQAACNTVEAINRETADLRQQWATNSWAEKETRLRQALTEAEQKSSQLESELSALAEQSGQAAIVAAPANVLLSSDAAVNRHRRRRSGRNK